MELRNYLVIDGKSSLDFDLYVSGGGTYSSPEKVYEEVEVPGRNGAIFLYEGGYRNTEVTYDAWIGKIDGEIDVDFNFRALRSYLLSREGYFRLEDSYHPEEFRFAAYNEAIEPELHESLQAATFTLTFSCKPQRFLKKWYDNPISYALSDKPTLTTTFYNDTYFNAKPLIRAYGTGTVRINDVKVRITKASSYTDIDCDLQEAYKDTLKTNCNANVELNNAQFPYLVPGENEIYFEGGIESILLYPRLFMI